MNNINKHPFELPKIEIIELGDYDIITTSPIGGPGGFEGEEEEFEF